MNPRPAVDIASLAQLLACAQEERRFSCELLDLRSPSAARANHLPGSASLPLSEAMDFGRELPAHMLPRAGASLIVFDEAPARARAAALYLADRGFRARYFAGSLAELPLRPGPCRGALWSPDPFLAEQRALLPVPAVGPVADLGAGNGRNAVYLAGEGYCVHCYDRLPDALVLARDRARRHGLQDRLTTHQIILTESAALPEGPFGLVLMIRFHEKSLMKRLRALLAPRGAVLLRTYTGESPTAARAPHTGPRRARHRLAPQELEELFPAREWSLQACSTAPAERQEPMIAFLARPRAG
jgi:rhodanese-related sulfurtransferase